MQWYIIVIIAFKDYDNSKLFSTQIKDYKKAIFEALSLQIFTLFLANSSPDQRFLRIVILRAQIVKKLAFWYRLIIWIFLQQDILMIFHQNIFRITLFHSPCRNDFLDLSSTLYTFTFFFIARIFMCLGFGALLTLLHNLPYSSRY